MSLKHMALGISVFAAACAGGPDDPSDPGQDGSDPGNVVDDSDDNGNGNDDGLGPAVGGDVSVRVTLHPIHADGDDTLVSFGAPFPKGVLASAGDLVVTNLEGHELASHVEELTPWRSLSDSPAPASVRSALVWVEVDFAGDEPVELELRTGGVRTLELGDQGKASDTFVKITEGDYPIALAEPPVYATFPAEWLSQTAIKTYTTPVGTDPSWGWYDDFFVGAAHTAVNDVAPTVEDSAKIDYVTDAGPWQLDRAMALFSTYVRTGDVQWLRHAHRATQFYRSLVDDNGYIVLKDYDDLKYSYSQSAFTDLMLTGDTTMLDLIERIAKAGEDWNPTYDVGRNFWTERHQTYSLLGALTAWEATGSAEHGERARYVAETSFKLASNPAGGWAAEGCMLHSFKSHENFGEDKAICSPWMSAIFADAAFRYYLMSDDPEALRFLAGLGDFVAKDGLYDGSSESVDFMVPWYLASSQMQLSDAGPWADVDHSCDVGGMVVRAAWAKKQLGEDTTSLETTAQQLIDGCKWDLDNWYRPATTTKPVYRLAPHRKFQWWFGAATDMQLLWAEVKEG